MKNLKNIPRDALKTIKGGFKLCTQGCNTEIGEICCGVICKVGEVLIPADPSIPTVVVCPKR
ncbi:hypothetical protein PYS58_13690 [Chryseobacterium indologenes]|uniref:bacteriocin-like protein n=1 Tax=Chryseobacterium indologenes TaxID=253 RepID=UPI0023E78960|nr:hypothetical protein [Chryseobacterium indologenes]WET47631.1 hypothetical protein PYS58_13690 [Chryseobacterium indologenes]